MKKSTANIVHTVIKTYGARGNLIVKSSALLIGTLFVSQVQAATQHVVEAGDTLSAIAVRYKMTQTQLIDANGLQATDIKIGQVLSIPDDNTSRNLYKVKLGDSLSSLSRKYNIDLNELARANNISPRSDLFIDSILVIPVRGVPTTVNNTAPSQPTRNLNISERRNTPIVSTKVDTASTVVNNRTGLTRHRIEYGDSLLKIARQYQVDMRDLAQANNMNITDTLYFGRYLTIPTTKSVVSTAASSRSIASTPAPASIPSRYIVQAGDTLMGVANRFNTDFTEIARLNGISPSAFLNIGQTLILPQVGSKAASSRNVASAPVPAPSRYVVQAGDTLMGVANRFNTDFTEIARLNGISPYALLAIGQTLILPKNATVSAQTGSY